MRLHPRRTRELRGVRRGRDVDVGRGVRLDAATGAQIVLGDGVNVGARTRVVAAPGCRVELGSGVVLGERCTIIAHAGVTIGARAQLGHGVVVVDFDHVIDDVERPIREQALTSAPVSVGADARIGFDASLLRGVAVGAGAIVDPRAVVTRDVAPGAHVGGVPARPLPAPVPPS